MSKQRKKKQVNEGPFDFIVKFSDHFFDSLKKNMEDKVIKKAQKAGLERDAIEKMKEIKRNKEELESILSDIPKAK